MKKIITTLTLFSILLTSLSGTSSLEAVCQPTGKKQCQPPPSCRPCQGYINSCCASYVPAAVIVTTVIAVTGLAIAISNRNGHPSQSTH